MGTLVPSDDVRTREQSPPAPSTAEVRTRAALPRDAIAVVASIVDHGALGARG